MVSIPGAVSDLLEGLHYLVFIYQTRRKLKLTKLKRQINIVII